MNITVTPIFENGKPSPDKAIKMLVAAMNAEPANQAEIDLATEVAKTTVDAYNKIKRKEIYVELVSDIDDILAKRKAILTLGYVGQVKLVSKKNDVPKLENSERQINVTEINGLVSDNIFSDAIISLARTFRNSICAYVAIECGKSAGKVGSAIGKEFLTWHSVSDEMLSINALTKSMQALVDEIIGDDSVLAKKSDMKTLAYWVSKKLARYGAKFASTEEVLGMVVDFIWATLNNKSLSISVDKDNTI